MARLDKMTEIERMRALLSKLVAWMTRKGYCGYCKAAEWKHQNDCPVKDALEWLAEGVE